MADDYSIDMIKSLLGTPLYANRYYVRIFPTNGLQQDKLDFNKRLQFMCKNVTIPINNYQLKSQYIGGNSVFVPQGYEPGQIDLQVMNTGKEYEFFYKWGELIYNHDTHTYGYANDCYCSVLIYEMDYTNNVIIMNTYRECLLFNIGATNLQYEQASDLEEFQVSIRFNYHEYVYNKPY